MDEVTEFLRQVVAWWAHWSTGGLLVAMMGLAQAFRGKPFRRRVQLSLFILFLLMAFFSVWEDARQKQRSAESNALTQKQRADYNQKRVDRLTDAHQKTLQGNSTNVTVQSA